MKAELESSGKSSPGLVRRLGLFDATMIVMGGIVGSGIFMNPYVVARQVRSPALILGDGTENLGVALANACLIAAAPALLAACIMALWELQDDHPDLHQGAIQMVRHAIAKAEGRE